MFVHPAPPSFPHSPKILSPVPTLEQSTSCTNFSSTQEPLPTSSPIGTRSPWSFSALFSSSPLQTFFGGSQSSQDGASFKTSEMVSPTSRARDSVESLRSSLDLPSRPSPPRKPQAHFRHRNQPDVQDHNVNTFVSSSNARSKNHFKPQKTSRGTSSWQLRQFAEATLGSGSLRKAVKLPEGEDINEWLAVNGTSEEYGVTEQVTDHRCETVVDFYNQINLLYGSITEFCSPQTCPEMKATDEYAKGIRTDNPWWSKMLTM